MNKNKSMPDCGALLTEACHTLYIGTALLTVQSFLHESTVPMALTHLWQLFHSRTHTCTREFLQVTAHQLNLQQEADRKAQQAAAAEAAKEKKRVVTEDSYSQIVETQNVNREASSAEARNVTEALSALGVQDEADKHPERSAPIS